MNDIKISRFQASDDLDSEETIAEYANVVKEEGGAGLLAAAFAELEKARSAA